MSQKECPLCISPLSPSEEEFYPCPCGYQICAYCFGHISRLNNLCPSCRRPFDAGAQNRVGVKYRPIRTESSPVIAPTSFWMAPKIVKIEGLPEFLLSADILSEKKYLGQYGKISKICVNSPNYFPTLKLQDPSAGPVVYVKFKTKEAAASCARALDGFAFGKSTLSVCLSIVENCTRATGPRKCPKTGCLKRHRPPKATDVQVTPEEIEDRKVKLEPRLTVHRPANYECYPRRADGVTAFPAPRMIPATGVESPFVMTQCYATQPLTLTDLLQAPGVLPLAPLPKMPLQQSMTSLAAMFHIETVA